MKHTVLFVDDDEKILQAWKRNFAQEPYTSVFAKSGKDALSVVSGLCVSVVVTDYSMPNGDGIALLTQLKKNRPDITRILVSGQATLKVASEAINDCGVFKLFEKPCSQIELGLAIRDALDQRDAASTDGPVATSLALLEEQYPGLTQVRRGPGGEIIISD